MNAMETSFGLLLAALILISPVCVGPLSADEGELSRETLTAYAEQLTVGSHTARKNATATLKKRGGHAKAVAPFLVERLATAYESPNAGMPGSAADFAERALESLGITAVPSLIEGLQHKDVAVRRRSAFLLGLIKDVSSIQPLIVALGDKERAVAITASDALGRIDEPATEAVSAVVDRRGFLDPSEVCPWTEVPQLNLRRCRYAIVSLGLINDVRSVETLLASIESPLSEIRLAAAKALIGMSIRAAESEKFLMRPENVARLVTALKVSDRSVQRLLVSFLKKVPDQAREPLLVALEHSNNTIRAMALEVCKTIFDDQRVPNAAVSILKDDLSTAPGSTDAIRYLREYHTVTGEWPDGAFEEILKHLNDSNPSVRSEAVFAATQSTHKSSVDPRVVPAIIESIERRRNDSSSGVMISAIGTLRDRRAVEPLSRLLAAQEISLPNQGLNPLEERQQLVARRNASRMSQLICAALAEIGDPAAAPALRDRIRFEEPFALEALGRLGDRDSVPDFVEQLLSGSDGMKAAAAFALTYTPDPRAIGPLTRVLKRELTALRHSIVMHDRPSRSVRTMVARLSNALAATMHSAAATALVQSLRIGRVTEASATIDSEDFRYLVQMDSRLAAIRRMGIVALPAMVAELQMAGKDDAAHSAEPEWSQRVIVWMIGEVIRSYSLGRTVWRL